MGRDEDAALRARFEDHLRAEKGDSPHTLRAYGHTIEELSRHLGEKKRSLAAEHVGQHDEQPVDGIVVEVPVVLEQPDEAPGFAAQSHAKRSTQGDPPARA